MTSQQYSILHSDEVLLSLTVIGNDGDKPLFQNYPIGYAQSMDWSFDWDTRIYRAIGDPPMGSDVFRNKLGAEGILNSVILKRHKDVPYEFVDIGAKLILGQYEYDGLGKKTSFGFSQAYLPYSEIELIIYAVSINRGYKFNRIVPVSAKGKIDQGDFGRETFRFISLDVSDFQGNREARPSPIIAYGQDGSH